MALGEIDPVVLIYLVASSAACGSAALLLFAARSWARLLSPRTMLAISALLPVVMIGCSLAYAVARGGLSAGVQLHTDGRVRDDISLLALRVHLRDTTNEAHLTRLLNRLGAELAVKPRGARVRVLFWLADEADVLAELLEKTGPGPGTPREINDLRETLRSWAHDYRDYGRSLVSGEVEDWRVVASRIREDRREIYPLTTLSIGRSFEGARIASRRRPGAARKWLISTDLVETVDQFSYNLEHAEAALVQSLATSQRLRLVAEHARRLLGSWIDDRSSETDLDDWTLTTDVGIDEDEEVTADDRMADNGDAETLSADEETSDDDE